jgi:cellulose synthase operon protein C
MIRQAVVVGVLLLLGGPLPLAQSQSDATTPAGRALLALNAGNYDEVDVVLRGATDPRSVAILARADIERGRYAEAEKRLTGPAASQPGSDAALELGLLQMYLGRRAEANRTLDRIFDSVRAQTAADYLRLGRAARALGQFQDANGFFRDANRIAPDDPVVNAHWGDILVEKYNLPDALKSFQIAVKGNAELVQAQLGMARVAAQGNPAAAKEAIARALKVNPRSVPGLLLSAEMAMDERRRDEARKLVQQALMVNPNSLEAHTLLAAEAFLDGRTADFEASAQKALSINKSYGEVYRVVGDHLGRNYRFDEAVELTQRALKIDPDNIKASSDLGSHLLRVGDEPGARVALERAWKGDPFDAAVKNSLELLDTLDKFVTLKDGDLIFRLDPEEAAVMGEQIVPLAKEAIATLSKRYQFTPKGPILIEMFPRHDDFAVRTIGLPGFVGALGACFGRVVTLDSPRAREPGQFAWQETLWHEIAHVMTLQMSNNRLPRWLSEGASRFEERRGRPEWGRDGDLQFAQALNDNKLLKIADIQQGFSDPELIGLTYEQASIIVEHLMETYGEPKFWELLRAYGRGLETDEALKATYGITIDQLQAGYDARVEKQFASLREALKRPDVKGTPGLEETISLAKANPGSFAVQMQLGLLLQKEGEKADAIQAFERAAQLVPRATGGNNPNGRIADIALEQKDTARAARALEDLLRADHTEIEAARKLASLVEPLGDAARTEEAYRKIIAIDPFDSAAQSAYGRFAMKRSDTATAIRAFKSALATKPPDRAAAHTDLAEALLQSGQRDEARKQIVGALEIAPSYERAQDLLLKIVN